MPVYTLKNGVLCRDGSLLRCPFVNRILTPVQTKLHGEALGINDKVCGSWCAKFHVEESGPDPSTSQPMAFLDCGSTRERYLLESIVVGPSAKKGLVN